MKIEKAKRLYNAHLHCHRPLSIAEGMKNFQERLANTRLAGGTLLSCTRRGSDEADVIGCDVLCLYYKEMLPGRYTAFASFVDYPEDQDYYLEFAKNRLEMGFDGFKTLLGEPSVRKQIGIGINDSRFDKFFAFLEEEGLPFVAHVGDPAVYWDKENAPEEVIRLGRLFDDSHLHLHELYGEFLDLLKKFPKLNLTFAHGLFMGDNHDWLKEIMDTYENVTIDLTPNAPLFVDMSEDIELWKKFFEDYQTRILFGTDTHVEEMSINRPCPMSNDVTDFLESPGPVKLHDGTTCKGIDIDGEMLENICWNNAIRRETPRPVNKPMAVEECKRLLAEEPRLKDWERENIKVIIEDFSK